MRSNLFLAALSILTWIAASCDQSTTSEDSRSKTKDSDSADQSADLGCQSGDVTDVVDCREKIPFSTEASITETCQQQLQGECLLRGCEVGYRMEDNACLPEPCDPEGPSTDIDCKIEIANSDVATKERTCKAEGIGYDYGPCRLQGCTPGYLHQGDRCEAGSCTPGAVSSLDCRTDKPGSKIATRGRKCNADGSSFDFTEECQVSACEDDYLKIGNACVAKACDPGASMGTVDCADEINGSSEASKSKSCNADGSDFVFGSCTVASCASGFHINGNQCDVDQCTAGVEDTVDCSLPNAARASKSRTCVGGTHYTYGTCTATSCNTGYTYKDGACVETFPQMTAATGSAGHQIDLSIPAFPEGVDKLTIYRFTAEPPASNWQCTAGIGCDRVVVFEAFWHSMTADFQWVDTTAAANTQYWYRYASERHTTTTNDLKTASATSNSQAIAYQQVVFLTATTYKAGAIGGLSGAESICKAAANNAGLARYTTYKGFLASNSQLPWQHVYIRGPLKGADGNLVAGTENQFLHGQWTNASLPDQDGNAVTGDFWVGTISDNCGSWDRADTTQIFSAVSATFQDTNSRRVTKESPNSIMCNFSAIGTIKKHILCVGEAQ